ncbi:MAG: histidine--tRNA ligase [Phycisphaerales bacterium]
MAARNHRFQAPKGTRDFLPPDMAVRRHIEGAWRSAAIRHGFDEVEGPTFEHVELYTAKSGPGIVSELFSFERAGGDTSYALRAEFTPTVARMAAALGPSAPRPIKWFSAPCLFRAERPQRGRLREHVQWNVDVLGEPTPAAEAEVIAAAADALSALGLTGDDVTFRISHRDLAVALLTAACGMTGDTAEAALQLLDRRGKLPADVLATQIGELGLDPSGLAIFDAFEAARLPLSAITGGASVIRAALDAADASLPAAMVDALETAIADDPGTAALQDLAARLDAAGLTGWCRLDPSIVRGLAYYTGTVFEVHEVSGRERAVAGGGRYDGLVELFGGPPTPAVGFGMGDVVLRLLLEDRDRLPAPESLIPAPDAFVLGDDAAEGVAHRKLVLLAALRRAGQHARRSYRATTKLRKGLEEANKLRCRFALIVDADRPQTVTIKSLASGEQTDVADADAAAWIAAQPAPSPAP